MASNTEYSHTLQHITDAKVEELSNKRQIFSDRKEAALQAEKEPGSPLEKLRALLNGVKTCFDLRVDEDGRVADETHSDYRLVGELSNLDRFLKQAEYDPSISTEKLDRWRRSLVSLLDVQSLKYEYATLFAQLTMEWLSAKRNLTSPKPDGFEELASSQKLDARRQWEELVFTPADCDADTITDFLSELFAQPSDTDTGTADVKAVVKALEKLREEVSKFETRLSGSHIDVPTLNWVIKGLLSSDLPTEKQLAVLREFQKDTTVQKELCDVLNMRLSALQSWSWGPEVHVDQRRQLNGSYHIYMHEDLIQAIFLHFIGTKWSVFFKSAFKNFRKARNVWKSPRSTVSPIDLKRRDFFLGPNKRNPNLQIVRESIHRNAYFVSQLMDTESVVRNTQEGEQEADFAVDRRRVASKRPMQAAARFMSTAPMRQTEEDSSDEEVGYSPHDDTDDELDPDQSYDTKYARDVVRPPNQMQAKQNLLRLLSADIAICKRLYGQITCFRSQYELLYPSLPHSTILAVLKFFGVSEKWLRFFETFLCAPLKFSDEPDAAPRSRRRGSPGSHILSEFFGEAALFCLDFMVNKETEGENLWRVNDDLWFWSRSQETNLTAWRAIQKFNSIMGLPLSEEKSGGAYITTGSTSKVPSSLPTGKIRWGMLYLNPESGRFEIDQTMVDEHIAELKRQLKDKEGSVFGWIQAWNSYASTFFTYNFVGTPANALGRDHVDAMLRTHERIQREIFSSDEQDRNVITYLRETIRSRFGNTSIPDAYFFFPIDLGGLELSSPFINLAGLRDAVISKPDSLMDEFFEAEAETYDTLKRRYASKDKDRLVTQHKGFKPRNVDEFMAFEEFIRHRETLNYAFPKQLVKIYDDLLRCPTQHAIGSNLPGPLSTALVRLQNQSGLSGIRGYLCDMTPYWRWVSQLYGPEIVEAFGGFNIVDPGLLPIGLVSQFRKGRVSWREE